jgi:bacterioferritin (cytochrome b1)
VPENDETLDVDKAIERLNSALELQYRSALQYALISASLSGIETQALSVRLAEFSGQELKDAKLLVEKLVSFDGEPTTEVAELRWHSDPVKAIDILLDSEAEAIEALQGAIEPTGREGRSEALEHMLEHMIMRKQYQLDVLHRARQGS